MLKVTEKVGQIADLPMHWVEAGEGMPVVLLHGWPQTWYQWRHLISALAPDYRVVAPDLRGCGATGRPKGGFDIQTMAGDISRLLDALGIAKAHVVGHDRGALIGYYLAATEPARILSLTALEANFPSNGSEGLSDHSRAGHPWHIPPLSARPEELIPGQHGQFVTQVLRRMIESSPELLTDDEIATYAKAYDDDGALYATRAYSANTVRNAQQIRQVARRPLALPVIAVAGDRSLGRGMIESIRRFVPAAAGVVMADCGHLIPEEHPYSLAELVALFVKRANRRRPRTVPALSFRACPAGTTFRAAG